MTELSEISIFDSETQSYTLHGIMDSEARARIGDLATLNTANKSNLVSAINELSESAGGGDCGITYIESSDTENLVVLRELPSGTYVLQGKFSPYSGATRTLSFSSKLLVNVITKTAGTHVQVFYPVNNVVQFLAITDDAYERTDIKLNELAECVLYVNITANDDGTYAADKSYDEIVAAYEAFRFVSANCDGLLLPMIGAPSDGDDAVFAYNLAGEGSAVYISSDGQVRVEEESLSSLIPTKVSQLENDSGFVTSVPTELKNPHKLIFTGAVSAEYDGSSAVTVEIPVGGEGTETETILSDNLFDKSIAVTGKVFYHGSSGPTVSDSTDCFYAYVPLNGAGTYRTKISFASHGESYAKRVPILKADNSFLQNVTGTITATEVDTAYDLEFTITEDMVAAGAAVYAFDGVTKHLNELMIVKDRAYPSTYIPYGYIEVEVGGAKASNVLSGKTAVFLGDSICAGTTVLADAKEYGYGWGGLIGEANKMLWKNYGRNGGTVTPLAGVDQVRWIPYQADLAIAAYPNADYVIFDGGANDGFQLGADGMGAFSESGYAPASDADFTGAFETLVLKLLNAYPTARVGYIVPPKISPSEDYSATSNVLRQYFDRAVEICKKWGVPVLDLWNGNPLNPKLSVYYDSSLTADEANTNGKCYTDGQHLTLTGYERITPQIEAWMRSL